MMSRLRVYCLHICLSVRGLTFCVVLKKFRGEYGFATFPSVMFSEDCRRHGVKTKQCVSKNFCFHKLLSFIYSFRKFCAALQKKRRNLETGKPRIVPNIAEKGAAAEITQASTEARGISSAFPRRVFGKRDRCAKGPRSGRALKAPG